MQPAGRFGSRSTQAEDDGWGSLEDDVSTSIVTQVFEERARSMLSYNDSPDIGFDRSLNPYRGCEHGCIYCYARPAHA